MFSIKWSRSGFKTLAAAFTLTEIYCSLVILPQYKIRGHRAICISSVIMINDYNIWLKANFNQSQ